MNNKRYDDALKRAEAILKVAQNQKEIYDSITTIFPELKESEDEEIRKTLIEYFNAYPKDYYCELKTSCIIAWLEKQGRKETTWNKEDEENMNNVLYIFNQVKDNFFYKEDDIAEKTINWLKSLKDRLCSNNEYDKDMLGAIEYCIKNKRPLEKEHIDWVEKQGEQKETLCDKCKKEQPPHSCQDITALGRCYIEGMNTSNKVEPKFKVGDWVVYDHRTYQIVELPQGRHVNASLSRNGKIEQAPLPYCEKWTINDAKPGDVLVFDDIIMIFKNIRSVCTANTYILYCDRIVVDDWCDFGDNAQPATKEQCDFLFKKMKECGYEWDAEKKEPKKIELQPSQWNILDFRTWQHIVCDVLTKYWGIGQYLDDGFCKKIAQDMQEEWNKKLCLNQDTTWSEEDEKILDAIVSSLNNEYFTRRLETLKGIGVLPVVDWLKSIKERMCTKSTTKTNRFKVL